MGISIFIWVAIAIISILIIRHNNKVKQEEQERQRQERERQSREWKEFKESIKQQDREIKKTIRQTRKAMQNAAIENIKTMADNALARTAAQGKAWHKAMDQAQAEFKERGIEDLSYQNAELIKRADEIYKSGIYADFEEDVYKKEIQKGEKIRQETNNTSKRINKFDPRITTTYQYADYDKQRSR